MGSHTYNHLDSVVEYNKDVEVLFWETQTAILEIFDAYNVLPKIFRPPYGSTNEQTLAIWEEMGLHTVTWDIDTNGHLNSFRLATSN